MTRRNMVAGLVAGTSLIVLTGCSLQPWVTFRFRMTVEVETPQGLKTGSSVMKISAKKTKISLAALQYSLPMRLTGEAVAVDLADGQTLFALVSDYSGGEPLSKGVLDSFAGEPNFRAGLSWDGYLDKLVALIRKLGRSASVGRTEPIRKLPTLVRFRNLSDPKTVELVDPSDLAKSFGPGVKLKSITLTIVDEPLTRGLQTRFPWWNEYEGRSLGGEKSGPLESTQKELPYRMIRSHFIREQ
jgi:hypothetical protein